jgi:hypothetical protein
VFDEGELSQFVTHVGVPVTFKVMDLPENSPAVCSNSDRVWSGKTLD